MGGFETAKPVDTAYIIHPEIKNQTSNRDIQELLDEAAGLAAAINLEIVACHSVNVSKIQAGQFLGKGTREALAEHIEALEPSVVIFNHALSPVQQRNLERSFKCKVIDRTGLILEIFGERAQTKEGRLQVELAALEYQKSRLVRSWTHLERQRGGAGFMGGPGETQIELDRRMIGERIINLKKQLDDVRRTRDLARENRERVPFPVVALVGYTNAGKSTLFNALTNENIFAKDLLFATLDPTMRRIALPSGQEVILSDTVGFISDLPTHLIAAFRATLEQTVEADVILHVQDVARPDHDAQREDVIQILSDLGIEYEEDPRIIEVYNKMDLIDDDMRSDLQRKSNFDEQICLISAQEKINTDALLDKVSSLLERDREEVSLILEPQEGKAISWLYDHANIVDRDDRDDGVHLNIKISAEDLSKFQQRFSHINI